MPPVRRRPHARMGSRRRHAWAVQNQSFTIAAGAHTTVDLLADLEVAGSSTLGLTIIRTHLLLATLNYSALTDNSIFGLIVVRDTDIGAGNGPNPNSDPTLDWMWIAMTFPTASGTTADEVYVERVDAKSKRKMPQLTQRYGCAVVNTAGASKNYQLYARTLVALP